MLGPDDRLTYAGSFIVEVDLVVYFILNFAGIPHGGVRGFR